MLDRILEFPELFEYAMLAGETLIFLFEIILLFRVGRTYRKIRDIQNKVKKYLQVVSCSEEEESVPKEEEKISKIKEEESLEKEAIINEVLEDFFS